MSDPVYYVVSGVLVSGVLLGISLMSKVRSAIAGNAVSAVCVAAAIVLTMVKYEILPVWLLWASMAVGAAISLVWTQRIKMVDMPQIVGLYNGFGGAASAFVAILTLTNGGSLNRFALVVSALAVAVGVVTLAGSLVAAGKFAHVIGSRQFVLKGHGIISNALLALILASVVLIGAGYTHRVPLVVLCSLASAAFGIVFSIRVGGADMPITISLLNSLSGVAGAVAGFAINDVLLVTIGGIVGASGLLLTQIMCKAMNRRLTDILFGGRGEKKTDGTAQDEPEAGLQPESAEQEPEKDVADIISHASKIIMIPGYGMALAQAQHLVKELSDKLEENGADVRFAIHPVAGRMPGHMNVLLCEADLPYDKLYELDAINDQFAGCDLAIVIGANDVVNPAARNQKDTPIYGMPVLNADMAKHVIICNYNLEPGYAGVDNPLYAKKGSVSFLLGDAKDSLAQLINITDGVLSARAGKSENNTVSA